MLLWFGPSTVVLLCFVGFAQFAKFVAGLPAKILMFPPKITTQKKVKEEPRSKAKPWRTFRFVHPADCRPIVPLFSKRTQTHPSG
jgi:hypothetical protein